MSGYVPGEQPKGGGIIKLNTNENPYPPSPRVGEALASFDYTRLRLYPDPLCAALRDRIAEIHSCPSECVFVGNGSDEVLALVTRAFVNDGGAVASFDPSYSLYPVLAEIRNVGWRRVPLADGFQWRDPVVDADVFFLTRPNAPTGIAYPKENVATFCGAFGGVVVIDEAYADFADDNCMDLATAPGNRNVIVSRTLSKSFSLAGIRAGYCVGPADLIDAMYKVKDSYNLDGVTQAIALAAVNDLDWMRGNAERIRATRGRVAAALLARGWSMTDSSANFLFARPPDGDARRVFDALRERRIFVRYFTSTPDRIRITIGTDAQMDAMLEALGDIN
jgi:histidinol-phosphate aminotransferase